MQLDEKIYIGYDNVIRLKLLEDDVAFVTVYPDHPPTRFVLELDDVKIDSSDSPTAFTWDGTNSIVEIDLGTYTSSPALTTVNKTWAKLVVYSDLWPNGIVWLHASKTPDKLRVQIVPS